MTRVVIYIPPDGFGDRYHTECAEHCARHGEKIAAVTRSAQDVWAVLDAGEADRVVVARPLHAAQLVRDSVEVVTQVRPAAAPLPRRPPPETSAGRPPDQQP